jgi:hypothetical protein
LSRRNQRLVHRHDPRLGIAYEHQLEARPELEKVLVHVPGSDAALVAGQLLDLADRPGAVFFWLGRDHQPGVRQAGELAQVLVVPGNHELADRRDQRIIAHDGRDGFQEYAFAVAARPIEEIEVLGAFRQPVPARCA